MYEVHRYSVNCFNRVGDEKARDWLVSARASARDFSGLLQAPSQLVTANKDDLCFHTRHRPLFFCQSISWVSSDLPSLHCTHSLLYVACYARVPPPPAARKPRSPSLSSMWSSQSRADLFPPCRALQAASKHFTPANRPLTTSTRLRLATPAKHPLSTLHADSPPCPAAQWAFDDAVIPHSRIPTALRLHMQRHSRRFPTHAPTRALPSVPLFHPPVKYCTHRPTELPHHRFHCPALPATTDGDQTAPQWFDANTAHLDIATLPTSQARSCRALCWPTSPTSRHQPALAPLNPTRRPSCRHVLPKSPARSQCAAERSGPRDAQFAVQLPATLTTPAPIPAPASPRPPARAWHAQQQWPRASRVL